MRIIQTTSYISTQGKALELLLSYAFVGMDAQDLTEQEFEQFTRFRTLAPAWEDADAWNTLNDNDALFRRFVAYLVTGLSPSQFQAILGQTLPASSQDFARAALDVEVVYERSPPQAEAISALLGKASWVGIGTFTGVGMSGGNALMMVVTVPFGIILIGTAVGVATGLNKGLAKRVESLIANDRKPGKR